MADLPDEAAKRAQVVSNDRWLRWCFFKGRLPNIKRPRVLELAVVVNSKAEMFVVKKSDLQISTSIKLSHATNQALRLCSCTTPHCTKVHLRADSIPEPILLKPDEVPILIHEKGFSPFTIQPTQTPPTAGLYFAAYLQSSKIVTSCHARACLKYRAGNCPAGNRCLYIHVNQEQLPTVQITPVLEASTPIEDALNPCTPEVTVFCREVLKKLQIKTLGDLQQLSPQMFDYLMASDDQHASSWMYLWHLRDIPETNALALTVLQFHGVTDEMASAIPSSLPDVGSVCRLKAKSFYALGLPIPVMQALELIRIRYQHATTVPSQTTLTLDETAPWFCFMAKQVTEFRKTHAHKSWRKQDATRPIVTSAVTWVDPLKCQCKAAKGGIIPPSPALGPKSGSLVMQRSLSAGRAVGDPVSPLRGESSTSTIGGGPPEVPTADHWCQCKRSFEICVNYELSTPSGSRCSEQNCLGKIASMGLPTSCIREVFVHGGVHDGEDPNPLFPCGVCENMFRRISKDVIKEHGADVMLYMFNSGDNPTKLVCLPVTEISHRAGSAWKKFLEEDVYDDAAGTNAE